MKKNLLSILFALILLSAKAQTYIPFPTDYGAWTYQLYGDLGEATGQYQINILSGDTALNSQNYKKITDGTNYLGGLREDSKIVYFIPDTSTSEYVLYNFNLNVGDTIFHAFPFDDQNPMFDTAIVWQIDSMQLNDGYHRVFHLTGVVEWTEGVGSNHHLLMPVVSYPVSADYRLDCFYTNSTILLNLGTQCITTVKDEKNEVAFTLSPNPATNQLTIHSSSFNKDERATVCIMNVLGQNTSPPTSRNSAGLSSGEPLHMERGEASIDVSKLPSGIYFLQLRTEKGSVTRKFVKE